MKRPLISPPRMPQETTQRAQAGQLDPHGRQPVGKMQPSAGHQIRQSEEDQLEIPAFLRRQGN
jgi:cell division protein FtsZ